MTPRAALALGLTLALLFVGAGFQADQASATTQQDEQVFIGLINDVRGAKGLAPLEVHPELATLARAWTSNMAANDQLVHSPDMTAGVTAPWTVLGENVGVHGIHDIDQLFKAFVNSPAHYKNLVDPRFNYVGVGVVNTSSGKLWTTHRFMAAEAPAPAETTPPQTTTTAPPDTTTTVPPTSTAPTTTPPTTPAPTTVAPVTVAPTTAAPITAAPTAEPNPNTTATAPSSPDVEGPATEAAGSAPSSSPTSIVQAEPLPQAEPDVETVEQVLMELVKAGI